MYKLKVGLVGVMQVNFVGDKQGEFDKAVKDLKTLSNEVAFDEKDETIKLWHYEPSPVCYANENGASLETLPLNIPDGSMKNISLINNLVFKAQKSSV